MFTSLIDPITPPYEAETETLLKKWMPPGAALEPLSLFRSLAQAPEIMDAMLPLGAYFLGPKNPLSLRIREMLILRTCANSGCAYEWGIHATAFSGKAGLSEDDVQALFKGEPHDPRWGDEEIAALQLCDDLCRDHRASEPAKAAAQRFYDKNKLMAIIVITGWYQIISKVANSCCAAPEDWAGGFPDTIPE